MSRLSAVMSNIVKIDGSLGEGGGQVLRIALSLSALYKIPVEIDNIRSGRPKPGLAAQHLKGVEIVRDMCNAKVKGAYIGSTRLEFHPGVIATNEKRQFLADTQTAGCICLLAQVAVPIALFLPPGDRQVVLVLKGGTNVPMGPHVEYLTEVFRPYLNKFGGDFDFTVVRRGYYPKGGGEVHLRIKPVKNLQAVDALEPGNITGISGWAYVAGSVHLNEAYQMADKVKDGLTKELRKRNIEVPPISIEAYREDRGMAVGNGSGINVVCQTDTGCVFGGSGLGSTKRDAPDPAKEAVDQIMTPIINKSCVDDHMQDQLVLLMAIAKGKSRISLGSQRLTQHTETAMQVAEIMLKDRGLKFQLQNQDSADLGGSVLECTGCGLFNDD